MKSVVINMAVLRCVVSYKLTVSQVLTASIIRAMSKYESKTNY
jgi:hypothetical protein